MKRLLVVAASALALAGPAMAGWIAGLWGWPWVAAWVALLVLPALALNRWLYQSAGPV